MDFFDALKMVDDAVDLHLSEAVTIIYEGVIYSSRGPLDREAYTDESSISRSGATVSTYSVQSNMIPKDPRGGYLSARGLLFRIADYEDSFDGRSLLLLDQVNTITAVGQFAGFPYPFVKLGETLSIDGYPFVYPITGV